MTMKLVEQRKFGDCVVATAATWLSKPYEEMHRIVAEEMGIDIGREGASPYRVLRHLQIENVEVYDCVRFLPCFASVKSINMESGSHSIILDFRDGEIIILDPSHLKKIDDLNYVYRNLNCTIAADRAGG